MLRVAVEAVTALTADTLLSRCLLSHFLSLIKRKLNKITYCQGFIKVAILCPINLSCPNLSQKTPKFQLSHVKSGRTQLACIKGLIRERNSGGNVLLANKEKKSRDIQ